MNQDRNIFLPYLPPYMDFEPRVPISFSTLDELLKLPSVARWSDLPNFSHFSFSHPDGLIAELDAGTWMVVGFVKNPLIGLPRWSQQDQREQDEKRTPYGYVDSSQVPPNLHRMERTGGRMSERRKPSKAERMTPCQICDYPISQRHHLFDIARYGENDDTVPLCANCHELYHLAYTALAEDSNWCKELFLHVLNSDRVDRSVCTSILGLCFETIKLHGDQGLVEPDRLAFDRIQQVFGVEIYVVKAEIHEVKDGKITFELKESANLNLAEGEEIKLSVTRKR